MRVSVCRFGQVCSVTWIFILSCFSVVVGNHVFHGNTRLCSSSSRISSTILIVAIVLESFFQFGSFLFFWSSAGFLFFGEQMDFRHRIGTFFCLTQQQAGERQHSSTLSFVKLPLTISETRWEFTLTQDPTSQLPFHDSNSWLLSLSGTPPLSMLLMPERHILVPFKHEPFATNCRQSVSFLCRGTPGDGAADTARPPKKKSLLRSPSRGQPKTFHLW